MQEILRDSPSQFGEVKMPNFKNINWLLVAGIATIAYGFVVSGWIGLDRILIYPTNNSLNEVGDFVAGVFAPLAVIWLICAVFTQRQELVDTRDQFKKNQEVVDAQLKTINNQSELLQQQHTLAEDTAKKTYRLSLFDQRYKIYQDFLAFGERHQFVQNLDTTYLEFNGLIQRANFVFGTEICDWFERISDAIYELIQLKQTPKLNGSFDDQTLSKIRDVRSYLIDQFRLPMEQDKFYKSMRVSDN